MWKWASVLSVDPVTRALLIFSGRANSEVPPCAEQLHATKKWPDQMATTPPLGNTALDGKKSNEKYNGRGDRRRRAKGNYYIKYIK